jgi:hypothetical protein
MFIHDKKKHIIHAQNSFNSQLESSILSTLAMQPKSSNVSTHIFPSTNNAAEFLVRLTYPSPPSSSTTQAASQDIQADAP